MANFIEEVAKKRGFEKNPEGKKIIKNLKQPFPHTQTHKQIETIFNKFEDMKEDLYQKVVFRQMGMHGDNIMINPETNKIEGILDFGFSDIGPAAGDLASICAGGEVTPKWDLAKRVIKKYNDRVGQRGTENHRLINEDQVKIYAIMRYAYLAPLAEEHDWTDYYQSQMEDLLNQMEISKEYPINLENLNETIDR